MTTTKNGGILFLLRDKYLYSNLTGTPVFKTVLAANNMGFWTANEVVYIRMLDGLHVIDSATGDLAPGQAVNKASVAANKTWIAAGPNKTLPYVLDFDEVYAYYITPTNKSVFIATGGGAHVGVQSKGLARK